MLYILIIVIIFVIVCWYIKCSNKLNRSVIKIDEALSSVDVALTKRYDVLTKMVDVVKSFNKHEKEVLFEAIKLRDNMSIKERNDANEVMDKVAKELNVIAFKYPEIKSSENYKLLQDSILDVEEHLQASRRVYNSNVSFYNQLIVSFPTSIVAKLKKMSKRDFFVVDEAKLEDVEVKGD